MEATEDVPAETPWGKSPPLLYVCGFELDKVQGLSPESDDEIIGDHMQCRLRRQN